MFKTPFFCTFFLTWRCNARCLMCEIWKKKDQAEMSLGEIDILLGKIPQIRVIRLSGGEPFLRHDLAEIVGLISRKTKAGIVHITTNGLLKEAILDFIRNNTHKKVHLKISLNAYGRRHDEIMGYAGAYNKVIETIEALLALRGKYKFYLGLNQTITDVASYQDSFQLRALSEKYGLSYLPVIAYQTPPLYGGQAAEAQFSCFKDFARQDLERALKDLLAYTRKIDNWIERCVKRYYLKGLYNRLVLGRNRPNPRCVALVNHIRVLPNGDIPVCLYNGEIVGNLLRDDFRVLWNSQKAAELRRWARACPGCWAECEVIPNAVFRGDIYKGLFI
jgi:MoaA/NifB/PqqE/SkfB family radical SAM enzyme